MHKLVKTRGVLMFLLWKKANLIFSYFNHNKYLIAFILIFLVILDLQGFQMNILSNVFAITSSPTVRQVVKDEENYWQEWKIPDAKNETTNETCKRLPSNLLPDIQSVSYSSDGDKLNVTLWLTQIYSEAFYEDILRNETFTNITEISSDFSSSSQLLNLSRSVHFIMAIDVVSVLDEGIDYVMELSSPTYDDPYWTENINEMSANGTSKLVDSKTFDIFPFNDKNYVDLSLDLKLIGNPDKYKLLFYMVDIYPINGEQCRIVDTTNWSLIPAPEFNIVPESSSIEMRPSEEKEKHIPIKIYTNSILESNAILRANYSNDIIEGEEKGKLHFNFTNNNITITPFVNTSATLIITALGEEFSDINIPMTIFANFSFPNEVTNREGDIYYSDESISIPESSSLDLRILPPYSWSELINNNSSLWTPTISAFVGIIGGFSAIVALLKRRERKEKPPVKSLPNKDEDESTSVGRPIK